MSNVSKEYIIKYSVTEIDPMKKKETILDEIKGHGVVKADSIKDIEDKIIKRVKVSSEDKHFKLVLSGNISTEENTTEEIYNKELFLDVDSILDGYLMIHGIVTRFTKEEHLNV